jgi:hypothetical protein
MPIYDAYGCEYKDPKKEQAARRDAEKAVCAMMAPALKNNDDLREFIRQAIPARRRDVYNFVVPHLKFKPVGFSFLV